MPRKLALLDYSKCNPEQCDDGICRAAEACRYRLISQEQPYDIPIMGLISCRGCAECAVLCPSRAIHLD